MSFVLRNIPQLVFFILGLLSIGILSFIAPKYKLHKMRSIPQIDAMKEAIGVCAEKGVPYVYTIGGTNLDSLPFGFDVAAVCEVGKNLAQTAAELNVRGFYSQSDATMNAMMRDYVRQGTMLAGHPERYREEDVIWMSGGIVLGTIGLMERNNAGALIIWGDFGWATHLPMLELATRRGAFVICGESWSNEGTLSAFFTDLVSICEEQTIAGPYLSNNERQTANIFGEDIFKLGYIGFIILLYVLGLAKVNVL